MPKVEDIFSQLNGTTYFSALDLRAGYHHIPLDEESISKTAFTSPIRKFKYVKVPFGLAHAPAYFQELMTGILKDFNFTIAYLDDIIIFSQTVEEHLDHIKQVFKKLQSVHLLMKLSKCNFFMKEMQYLGHILSTKGIKPLPSKTKAIQNMHPPKMPKQIHPFLGLIGYYRKFIKNFVKLPKPLTLLTHQQAKFEWTSIQHNAFLTLKESIIQAPILNYPNLMKCYMIYKDASDDACRVKLSQEHDDKDSLSLTYIHRTQRKWSTTEQEAYGVYYVVTKWNDYLQGAEIIVRNDHKLLARFLNGKNASNEVNQWGLELAT